MGMAVIPARSGRPRAQACGTATAIQGGSRIRFDFRGKSGTDHHIDLRDRKRAAIVRRCQDLPGQELFQYLDDEGQPHTVGSDDVNAYLREITGEDITAKDFRTWAATNLAALALQRLERFDSQAMVMKNVVYAVEAISKMLGNTNQRRFAIGMTAIAPG